MNFFKELKNEILSIFDIFFKKEENTTPEEREQSIPGEINEVAKVATKVNETKVHIDAVASNIRTGLTAWTAEPKKRTYKKRIKKDEQA